MKTTITADALQVGDVFCVPPSFGPPQWWVLESREWLYTIGGDGVAMILATVTRLDERREGNVEEDRAIPRGIEVVIRLTANAVKP